MAVAQRKDTAVSNETLPPTRAEVFARYRQLREISKRHHSNVLQFMPRDMVLRQARRLGLAHGRTIFLDDPDEMNYVCDLAIHTASPGRSRAIDRYAKAAQLAAGSDEALVLEAMRAARFCLLTIERRHEVAGLVATDLFRKTEVWLVDIGLESSMPEGATIATRLYTPEAFSITAGVNVPLDGLMLTDINAELPHRLAESDPTTLIDDPRFAETVYRVALAGGIMDRMTYQDVTDGV